MVYEGETIDMCAFSMPYRLSVDCCGDSNIYMAFRLVSSSSSAVTGFVLARHMTASMTGSRSRYLLLEPEPNIVVVDVRQYEIDAFYYLGRAECYTMSVV